jgi:hypothetical protein
LAALPLVSALLEKQDRHVIVTTGTVTSAQLMAERLPERAFHQYVPIDSVDSVRHFLRHWRPDLALFVESELWPNLILETHAQGIPLGLINARLSERSFRGWNRASGVAKRLLSCFDECLAQDALVADRLRALGAKSMRFGKLESRRAAFARGREGAGRISRRSTAADISCRKHAPRRGGTDLKVAQDRARRTPVRSQSSRRATRFVVPTSSAWPPI